MKPKNKFVFTEAYLKERGYVEVNGVFFPPNSKSPELLEFKRTNVPEGKKSRKPLKKRVKSNEPKIDLFIILVQKEFGITLTPEHRFHELRRWRMDYACIEHKFFIEVEGGIHTGGRHTRGVGFENDMEKYNEAIAMGWRLIRVTPSSLMSQNTLELIRALLK